MLVLNCRWLVRTSREERGKDTSDELRICDPIKTDPSAAGLLGVLPIRLESGAITGVVCASCGREE
jgi:hypothetical protein